MELMYVCGWSLRYTEEETMNYDDQKEINAVPILEESVA